MYERSGDILIQSIRQLDATVPIIVMTANIQKPAREKVEALGVTGFVTKPVIGESIKTLRALLTGCLHAE